LVVVITKWIEPVLHGMAVRKSKPTSVRDMPVTFWMVAPAHELVGAVPPFETTRARLCRSVGSFGVVPILLIQAEASAPDVESDTYGRAYMLLVVPPPLLLEVMINDTVTVAVFPPAEVTLI
jgi:hypothetical protein